MYSKLKVAARLTLMARTHGFDLVYHSIEEVDAFEASLVDGGYYDMDLQGNIVGMLEVPPSYRQWMTNEILLCIADAEYFLTRYAYLKDEQNIIRRFRFRVPQRIYFDIIAELEERDLAIELLILKARQLGMSIMTELLMGHRVFFNYGANSIIGSADQTKTTEMSKMMLLCYDRMPIWMRPEATQRVESDRGKIVFGKMASGISFQHGSQKFGIGTGTTPTIYHLSEVALYGDAAVKLIDEGLWKAVHASVNVFGALESTGRSNVGWWAKTWYYSKANYPNCRMYPMFLPWFCGTDIYPNPTWLRAHPRPPSWIPRQDTRTHAAKAALYVASNKLLRKHLLAEQVRRDLRAPDDDSAWEMPVDQQWFWEINYEEAKTKGIASSFLQEMAASDEEALQRAEQSVFGPETIELLELSRQRDFETYTLVGQSIEASHEVDASYFDYSRQRLLVQYQSRKQTSRWELIPLRPIDMRPDYPEDADGVLCIYEQPKPGINYALGVDTGGGMGQDSTAISVWAIGDGKFPDTQVAEFASSAVSHVEAFAFILCIAAHYGRYMYDDYFRGLVKWREPYVSIEQLASSGDTGQHQMHLLGYTNFHKMPRYDNTPQKIRRMKRSQGAKTGWFTNAWSRPMLLGTFKHWVSNGWAKINSPWLIDEMKHFETRETSTGRQKMEAEEEYHDDRIFAAAMGIFPPHDMDKMAERSQRRTILPDILPPLDLSPMPGGLIIPGSALETKNLRRIPDQLENVLYTESDLDRYY